MTDSPFSDPDSDAAGSPPAEPGRHSRVPASDGGATVRRMVPRHGPPDARVCHRVLADMDALVARLGVAYRAVPEYAALGDAYLRDEVLVVSRQVVEGFFAPIAREEDPRPDRLGILSDMGRRRLEMGVPLEPMLHVYRICGGVVWRAVAESVEPGEEHVLGDLGARWIDYIDTAASLAAAAYVDASNERIREVDARRQALIEALLAAQTPAEVAAVSLRFSVNLAPGYVPVVVQGDEVSAGIDRVLASAPDGTLGGGRGGRLLLLLPRAGGPGPVPEGHLTALWRTAGRPHVAVGSAAAPGPELLDEVGRTEALLETMTAARVPTGVYGPEDLVVPRLLAADPKVASVLARRITRLTEADAEGTLRSTLATYLECGAVPATAEREFVHPNTVLYRLRRVHELTGLDPRTPVEATQLVLALQAAASSAPSAPPSAPSAPPSKGAP